MALTIGLLAALLTAVVAIYTARKEGFTVRHTVMLGIAAILAAIATAMSWAEQQTFEKYVLGGDSYVYVIFESLDETASKFVLHHDGDEFPAYDVSIEIFDLRKFVGVNTNDPRVFGRDVQKIERAVFPPDMATSMLNSQHPTDCYGYWLAVTRQRKNSIMSLIQARRIDGTWQSATRVLTMDDQQRIIGEYSTDGWDANSGWPTITVRGPGSYHTNVPTLTCP